MVGLFFNRKSKSDREETGPLPDFEAPSPALYDPHLAAFEDTTPDALPGMPDLYAVIGVDARASDDTIRYAYRRRASRLLDARWRPGRAARRLAELNAAYEILGKPDRRADYDRQRMREAAYERARLAATRAESFQTASYTSVDSAPDYEMAGFGTTGADSDGAFRDDPFGDGIGQPAGSFRDGAFHDSPTLVGIDGAAVARPAQPTRPAQQAQTVQPTRHQGLQFGLPNTPRQVVILLVAALLVLAVVAGLVSAVSAIDFSSMAAGGQSFSPLRVVPTATVPAGPTPTPRPVLVQQPSVPTATPAPPTPTLPPRPTVAARPTVNSSAGAGAIGSQVRITDQNPPRRADVGVTVRLTRDGRPLPNVPVELRVYYRTVEERWPPGDQTVPTNASGEATIVFNVGDATPGYEAQVVAVANVGGELVQMQTSFVPR